MTSAGGDNGGESSSVVFVVLELLVGYMPLWVILSLGVYALSSVLYRVLAFGRSSGRGVGIVDRDKSGQGEAEGGGIRLLTRRIMDEC